MPNDSQLLFPAVNTPAHNRQPLPVSAPRTQASSAAYRARTRSLAKRFYTVANQTILWVLIAAFATFALQSLLLGINSYLALVIAGIAIPCCVWGLNHGAHATFIARALIGAVTLVAPGFLWANGFQASVWLPLMVLLHAIMLPLRYALLATGYLLAAPLVFHWLVAPLEQPVIWARTLVVTALCFITVRGFVRATGTAISEFRVNTERLSKTSDQQELTAATLGHEVRTPVATLDMLLDEALRSNDPDTLRECKRVTRHLLSILDELGGGITSTVGSGRAFSIFETMERAVSGLASLASERHVLVVLGGDKASPFGHIGNASPIQQIVQNLIKNAILHSGGDRVSVFVSHERVAEERTAFEISMADNGCGIPADQVKTLFEPFTRGHSAAPGAGIGLNICQRLADALPEGELSYQAHPAGGSIFILRFTLERAREQERRFEPTRNEASLPELRDKRVLLVDDTEALRRLGKLMLTRMGASEVALAGDGREALALCNYTDFDIILVDIIMPGIGGEELVRRLRAQGFHGPIIGVTAATIGRQADQLVAAGANAVLAKPLSASALANALRDAGQHA